MMFLNKTLLTNPTNTLQMSDMSGMSGGGVSKNFLLSQREPMNTLINKYQDALHSIPAPGGGGCHTALLGTANLGIMAGLTDQQIFADLRNAIPSGGRRVPDREIMEAINRARMDTAPIEAGANWKPLQAPPKPRPVIKQTYLDHLLEKGRGIDEVDFWKASPIRLYDEPERDALLLLDTLYSPKEILFMGERFDTDVRTVEQWRKRIEQSGTEGLPHIIPNPVTGKEENGKSGKPSFRCDAAISSFRFAVVEFDNLSKEEQFAFWATIPLPVAALIDSGGKSIHGWIATEGIRSAIEWTKLVETELYARRLIPLGVDPACRNEARLSRLPGHLRAEKGRWQRLLYLNPSPACKTILK